MAVRYPIEIEEGLWLEKRGSRLEWNLSLRQLLAKIPPNVRTLNHGVTTLAWHDRVWGIWCQITTQFGEKRWPQTTLRGIRMFFFISDDLNSLPADFNWVQERLTALFGPPASLREDSYFEEGVAVWSLGELTLRHEYNNGFFGHHCVYLFLPLWLNTLAAELVR